MQNTSPPVFTPQEGVGGSSALSTRTFPIIPASSGSHWPQALQSHHAGVLPRLSSVLTAWHRFARRGSGHLSSSGGNALRRPDPLPLFSSAE